MNKRKDFLHKISKEYANRYEIVERLNTKDMIKNKPLNTNKHNRGLHRHLADASFRMFIDMLRYKDVDRGRS